MLAAQAFADDTYAAMPVDIQILDVSTCKKSVEAPVNRLYYMLPILRKDETIHELCTAGHFTAEQLPKHGNTKRALNLNLHFLLLLLLILRLTCILIALLTIIIIVFILRSSDAQDLVFDGLFSTSCLHNALYWHILQETEHILHISFLLDCHVERAAQQSACNMLLAMPATQHPLSLQ